LPAAAALARCPAPTRCGDRSSWWPRTDDVALPPGEYGWDRFAERIKTAPVSVPGSHESMFTRPAELADAILQLASAR